MNLGFHKMREIPSLPEDLSASLEELFSLELFDYLFTIHIISTE
jgi:hypothetical protein